MGQDWAQGIRSATDVLLWGQAYPRSVDIRDLEQLRTTPRTPTKG